MTAQSRDFYSFVTAWWTSTSLAKAPHEHNMITIISCGTCPLTNVRSKAWARLYGLSQSLSVSGLVSFEKPARYMTASFHRLIRSAGRTRERQVERQVLGPTSPMPIAATGVCDRDHDHRRALQSLLAGKLPRADRHQLGLRSSFDAVLPDGRAPAGRVDEATSGRAPCRMALCVRQARSPGSLKRS